jgi:hypothetical protein
MDMLYKSCSISHKESIKIGFAFSDLSMIFYAFYKFQMKCFTIEDSVLQTSPWKLLAIHNHTLAPYSQAPALFQSEHIGPRRRKGAHRRRGAAGHGQQMSWGGVRPHLEVIGCSGGVGESVGELQRRGRGCAVVAA